MKLGNHYKIGRLICQKMAENDMPLNEPLFVFGNLAPDLTFSYLYRAHVRALSSSYLDKRLQRLYKGGMAPGGARFSFYLGVMTHYICDFFCYPHTPAFKGGVREHVLYSVSIVL
jgi:hypothetical protein